MTNIKVVVGALIVLIVVSLIAVRFRSQQSPRPDVPPLTVPAETVAPEEAPATGGQTLPSQSGAMTLAITSPANAAIVTNASLTVSGKTATRAEVFVNDKEARADASGNFSVVITLDEGDNAIVVMANDAEGNVAEKELTVTYNSGQ